jgi:hypothetical protein
LAAARSAGGECWVVVVKAVAVVVVVIKAAVAAAGGVGGEIRHKGHLRVNICNNEEKRKWGTYSPEGGSV